VPSPTFEAVAVKVTLVPRQIVPIAFETKFTNGLPIGELTDRVTAFDFAVVVVKHEPPLIVITQVTASLFAKVELVKVFAVLFCTSVRLTRN
jgi:hypothetical protein